MRRSIRLRILPLLLSTLVVLPCGTGCVALMANLIHAGWGSKVQPKFTGFDEKRVAVVCVSRSSLFGPSSAAKTISQLVHHRVSQGLPKAIFVETQTVEDWIDRNGWNETDFREVGAGVDAQMLIAIDIMSFSLHEGNTLYRGRADVEVSVLDIDAGGKVVFKEIMPQVIYPTISGQHITDTTESEFRTRFIKVVAEQISRNFVAYERIEDFSRDTANVSF